jgi:hypothetical protein
MHVSMPRDQNSDLINFSKGEHYEPLNKEDRHRRFDLLLNNLRYAQKPAQAVDFKKKEEQQECTSVFSKEVTKRYQI